MKKLGTLKNINTLFSDSINELYTNLQNNIKDVKDEYQQNIIDEKIKLLVAICNGENLNIKEMKQKYLKPNELENIEPCKVENINIDIDDNILDKITVNNHDYYVETCKNNIVYNVDNEPVGIYKNGTIIFN